MDNFEIINIKKNIEILINNKHYDEAIEFLDELLMNFPNDLDIHSMKSVALSMKGDFKSAINICEKGLEIDIYNFDLNYNLAYIYNNIGEYSKAITFYNLAMKNCNDENLMNFIEENIEKIKQEKKCEAQEKIVFFVNKGLDSFLDDIVTNLLDDYVVKKVIVNRFSDIDKWMEWSDICWFEWCDELIGYGSKHILAKERKIICRLHRYEAFTDYPNNVEWINVDKLIVVADHIKDKILKEIDIEDSKIEKVCNGIDANKFIFKRRKKGFNLACIGYLNLRKNPMMIIQLFNEIVKLDNRYKLFFAGNFQDDMLKEYMYEIIIKLGLEKNIVFDGYINNEYMVDWLSDKNYIITGSIGEGHPVGIMEAMMCGIKPCIHYFPGVEKIYPKEYIWESYEDAIKIIFEDKYDSNEYCNFIKENYTLSSQINQIKNIILNIKSKKNNKLIKGIKNNDFFEYISGNKFSSSYKIQLDNDYKIVDRMNYIINKCDKKKIIHLGCADHIQLIDDKRKSGLWLHDKISEKAKKCIGFDINKEAIEYIKDKLSINNVFFDDIISNKNKKICKEKWDIIVIGEILEHTNNPVDFLTNIKTLYSGVIDKVLITVPNALKLENYMFANNSYECINSDHRYWFTPYTITKIMHESGISIEEIQMVSGYKIDNEELKKIFKNNKLLMDTIIAIGKL